MSDFLPDDYQTPSSGGGYMKFKQGENRFRILEKPIIGWEGWKNKAPTRFRYKEKPVTTDFDDQRVNLFWAMLVFNYNENELQILEITQKTIMKSIEALSRNVKWGPPYDYDLIVTRTGEGMDTEYATFPDPKTPISDDIRGAMLEKPCDVNKMFDGDDPWDVPPIDELKPKSDLPF